jgi:DNA processing protein
MLDIIRMQDEIMYKIALSLTPGVGDYLIKQLVSYCGSATEVFKYNRSKLIKIPGVGIKTADALLAKGGLRLAEQEYRLVEKEGAEVLFYTDKAYPNRLKSIADAPALLYFKGNTDLNAVKVVAIVGTRKATPYGKEVTEEIVSSLRQYESVLIVSGLAYGIDSMAHKAALAQSMPTVGVMATGIDIVYPAAHKGIAQQMQEQGGLLTEYKIGTKPEGPFFPARNRIIAGMTDVLIVVEAAEKGGALITAEIANSYNKDIFAVPGNLGSSYSEGCNKLIRDLKAHIYTGIRDLEYVMNWEQNASPPPQSALYDTSGLTEEEQRLLALLTEHKELLIDDLSWRSQLPLGQLASMLLNLELQGFVKVLPGKRFAIASNRRP